MAAALVAAAFASTCRTVGEPRLTGGASSMDALVEAYTEAVIARDTAAMHALRLTEREHTDYLYPELPAAQNNFSPEFLWESIDRSSIKDAVRIADDHGGEPRNVVATRCRRDVTEYQTFRVHGDCWVTWEDSVGRRQEVKLFGSVVEMDGRFKIVGIIED